MMLPLVGYRVIDLTRGLAGPYATMILGDLGAEIVKVEPPDGDPTRRTPPHFLDWASGYFLSVNRNKKSIVLNLTTPEGRELLLELVRQSHVIIDNFRPGVMARLGLEYSRIQAANPKVVACSISGFGESGPLCRLPAYDLVIQAMSGGMSLTGHPGNPPTRMGLPIGDLAGGVFAAIGILGALAAHTGEGRKIEISLLDCQAALLVYQAIYYFLSGKIPGPQGSGHPSLVPYQAYQTADGYVLIAAHEDTFWRNLCTVLELPNLAADPRFVNRAGRVANCDVLNEILTARFRERPTAEWVGRLWDAGIPAGPVLSLDQILTHPQLTDRGQVQEMKLDTGSCFRMVASPIRLDSSPSPAQAPPRLGQHTEEILASLLGYSKARLAELRTAGIVG